MERMEAQHSLVYVAQRSEIGQQAFSGVTFNRSQLICLIVRPIYLSNTNIPKYLVLYVNTWVGMESFLSPN